MRPLIAFHLVTTWCVSNLAPSPTACWNSDYYRNLKFRNFHLAKLYRSCLWLEIESEVWLAIRLSIWPLGAWLYTGGEQYYVMTETLFLHSAVNWAQTYQTTATVETLSYHGKLSPPSDFRARKTWIRSGTYRPRVSDAFKKSPYFGTSFKLNVIYYYKIIISSKKRYSGLKPETQRLCQTPSNQLLPLPFFKYNNKHGLKT